MQIREIKNPPANPLEYKTLRPAEAVRTAPAETESTIRNPGSVTAWQKDILLSALDKLENIMHTDNNLPLNKQSSGPIESFEEALIELSFTRTPFFKAEASQAQANINAEDVLSLFLEN